MVVHSYGINMIIAAEFMEKYLHGIVPGALKKQQHGSKGIYATSQLSESRIYLSSAM